MKEFVHAQCCQEVKLMSECRVGSLILSECG